MTSFLCRQTYLDRMALAVMDQDWETYRQGVDLPFKLITDSAILDIVGEDDLYDGFVAYSDVLASLQVQELRRTVVEAELAPAGTMTGSYIADIVSRSSAYSFPRSFSSIYLRTSDSGWAATSIVNNTSFARWPVLPTPGVRA